MDFVIMINIIYLVKSKSFISIVSASKKYTRLSRWFMNLAISSSL